jgi:hypothetical protein
MDVKLSADGYEKIDARIQKIENLANNGIFAEESRNARFYQIVSEAKKLRQVLREVLYLVPTIESKCAGGDAA